LLFRTDWDLLLVHDYFSQHSEGLGLVARDISPSVFREALIRRSGEEHPKNFHRFEFAEIFEYKTQERQQKLNLTGSVDSPFPDTCVLNVLNQISVFCRFNDERSLLQNYVTILKTYLIWRSGNSGQEIM
jgi:hypothetical protein